MSLIKQILEGWANYVESSKYTKKMMEYRLEICMKCPFKEKMGTVMTTVVQAIHEDGSVYKCSKCNCPLASATASPTKKCPEGKWEEAGVTLKL